MMTMELRGALTPFPSPLALARKGRIGNPPLGKTPPPSWPCRHLPFAPSTVQWRGQLEAGHAQQLPKHVGAHGWAVEPQEACQTEGRGRLRLGQGWPPRNPLSVTGSRLPTPKGPSRPHRRVQLQWKRGSWALLSRWNLVS